MSSITQKSERRRSPRVKKQIALKISLEDYDVVGQTLDISSIGAHCNVSKYIPPFSIISIALLLPLKNNNGKHNTSTIRCQGAVVRCQPNTQNQHEYNIAIYFSRLKQSDKTKLLHYVHHHL